MVGPSWLIAAHRKPFVTSSIYQRTSIIWSRREMWGRSVSSMSESLKFRIMRSKITSTSRNPFGTLGFLLIYERDTTSKVMVVVLILLDPSSPAQDDEDPMISNFFFEDDHLLLVIRTTSSSWCLASCAWFVVLVLNHYCKGVMKSNRYIKL